MTHKGHWDLNLPYLPKLMAPHSHFAFCASVAVVTSSITSETLHMPKHLPGTLFPLGLFQLIFNYNLDLSTVAGIY